MFNRAVSEINVVLCVFPNVCVCSVQCLVHSVIKTEKDNLLSLCGGSKEEEECETKLCCGAFRGPVPSPLFPLGTIRARVAGSGFCFVLTGCCQCHDGYSEHDALPI